MNKATADSQSYRFGGHQSFALRTAWLPKAAQAVQEGDDVFSDPLRGVVRLGLGKNMVESLRVWIEAYGIAARKDGKWALTPLGEALLGPGGYDRFLEDEQTLWLLHWNIATLRESPFFAWELLINRWSERFFTTSEVMTAFAREAERAVRPLSSISARQHFDVWLHTYLRGRNGRGEEGIDSPLSSLGLVVRAGDRETAQGRREPVFAFDLDPKPIISDALFAYCLHDWWSNTFEFEETVSLSSIAFGHGAPGRVFRMPEEEVLARVMRLASGRGARIELIESFNQFMLRRAACPAATQLLRDLFRQQPAAELIDA
ncbi:DUF4007 family protein [Mesorhizobium sp. WSM3873]|uniref:DUF4007 family protein n=1 Tax=Mesorhizobium sp. WSM3873 TaxID=1854056 RepID=UPI000800B302|nr:DUF4007 family protein [Mesorhizobium sp. WSM3873]OBQ86431.1 hypothetical protein A9K71_17005 [Mesorhizobium sp. WSM3873]TIW60251.1 MAG: DUF4007 family protein [Mesorhizobium sp.]